MRKIQSALAPPVRPLSLFQILTRGLVTVGLVVGIITTTTVPTHAASSISGCFKYYKGGSLQGSPVMLEAYTVSGWYKIGTLNLGVSGCISGWQIPYSSGWQGYYLRLRMYYPPPGMTGVLFYGTSGYWALPGNQPANVGTATVYCSGTTCGA